MYNLTHFEVKTYEYGDVKVMVQINYDEEKVSLIERSAPHMAQVGMGAGFKGKNYLFIHRTSEYRNGWLNVLKAMEYAMNEAFDELEAYIKTKQKEKMDNVEAVLMEATGIVKKRARAKIKK